MSRDQSPPRRLISPFGRDRDLLISSEGLRGGSARSLRPNHRQALTPDRRSGSLPEGEVGVRARLSRRAQSGLTLIEVLVAIAVLAGAVGAVLVLMATQARGAAALSDKALARIVAENAMVAVVIGEETGRSPSGTEEIGGQEFAWEAARTNAPLPGLDAVTVSVRRDGGEQVLAGLATLLPSQETDN